MTQQRIGEVTNSFHPEFVVVLWFTETLRYPIGEVRVDNPVGQVVSFH